MKPGLRILVCSDTWYPPRGGGDISLRAFCSRLASEGAVVAACYIGDESDPDFTSYPQRLLTPVRGFWPRLWYLRHVWPRHLRAVVRRFAPDVVITQQAVSASTLDICSQEGIRSVLFLQNVDFFCLGSFWSGKPWKCEYRCIGCSDSAGRAYQFPCFRTEIQRTRRSLSAASEIVTNSEFMKRTLRDLLDLDSIVVEPEARDLAPKDSTVRKEELLFFSPLAHKGVDIALALAKRLPSRRFLFVGDTRMKSRLRMSSLENVEYLTWTDAPLRCYQRSRLLLVPSRIPEGFGMACVEAMGLGIPCIVSDVGALPETVGRGGDCVSTWAVDAWVEAIARYDDPSYYHQKSQEAIEQARKLESFPRYERLLSIIDEIIS